MEHYERNIVTRQNAASPGSVLPVVSMLSVSDRDVAFREFVVGSQTRMVAFAEFMVGDRHRAQDLVQDAYVAAYAKWGRIDPDLLEPYVRRCIVNGRTSWWRRRSSSELPVESIGDLGREATGDRTDQVDSRLLMLAALTRLTARERTVLVMRFYLELSEAEIAAEIGLAPGTVKSTAARAVGKLREDPQLREGASRDST
jgi:RNA polymerase sigma-70 factor (sigma-E family)